MAAINVNELVKQKEYDFLRKEKQLGDNIIFLVVAGSHAYGLSTPDSDVDVRGVALETPETLFGLDNFESYNDESTDTVIYSLKKFVQLTMKGAPNMLELLYTRPEDIIYVSPVGKLLLENRDLFVSKRIYATIRGFTKNSLRRLEKDVLNNPKKANKDAIHLIRLYREGIEVLKTGSFSTYQTENISEFMAIRNGKYTYGNKLDLAFYDYITKLENELEDAYQCSNALREMVDRNRINDLMIQIYCDAYNVKINTRGGLE